jgi:RNA polymerase sigma-70 factor (ECF subfamily)
LAAARAGDPEALGRLLDTFRPVLLAAAIAGWDDDLRAKAGASDLVQESLLEGQRDFAAFRGRGPDELLAWLKQILAHNIANLRRQFRDAAMRDVAREVPLPARGPDALPGECLPDLGSSPSGQAARREGNDRLRRAMDRLPEHYRNVVVWHHRDGLTFDAIGRRLNRPAEGARQLWWRALKRLKDELGNLP